MDEAREKEDVGLYLDNKKSIDDTRKEVEILFRQDMNLGYKIDNISIKMDSLKERIDEGISKTAWNTWTKVQEISSSLKDMTHYNEKQDGRISSIETNFDNYAKRNDREVGRFKGGVYWIAFIGVSGSLFTFFIWLIQNIDKIKIQ